MMKIWEYQILPMSHNQITIKEGAFLISDAHYSHKRVELLDLFKDIQNKKLKPTQLILMGDIFDVLIGGVSKSIKTNIQMLDILNDISANIEVIYLEGNHDFNLKHIFSNIKVFTLSMQPVECKFLDKKIYLAHGDFNAGLAYRVYSSIIRNKFVLLFLNFIDTLFDNIILNKLDKYLDKKDDCKEIENFESIIKKRLFAKYRCDYFIEGHFHQNKFVKFDKFNYFNLAAFACNQRYFIVKSAHEELLVEKQFSKG